MIYIYIYNIIRSSLEYNQQIICGSPVVHKKKKKTSFAGYGSFLFFSFIAKQAKTTQGLVSTFPLAIQLVGEYMKMSSPGELRIKAPPLHSYDSLGKALLVCEVLSRPFSASMMPEARVDGFFQGDKNLGS